MIVLLPLHNTGWCWIVPLLTPPLLPQPQGKVLSIMRVFCFCKSVTPAKFLLTWSSQTFVTQSKVNFGLNLILINIELFIC